MGNVCRFMTYNLMPVHLPVPGGGVGGGFDPAAAAAAAGVDPAAAAAGGMPAADAYVG